MKIGSLEVYGVIYKIENMINKKVYIGQTINKKGVDGRYSGDLKKYTHNSHLKNAINKYGIDNFIIHKNIDYALTQDELNQKERYWIDFYKSTNCKYGYNKRDGGGEGLLNDETKDKISKTKQINRDCIINNLLTKVEDNIRCKQIVENHYIPNNCLVKIPVDVLFHDNGKLLLIMSYSYVNTNRIGISSFNLNDLIIGCGYKVDTHKGKSFEQFRDSLIYLKDNKYLNCDLDLNIVKPKDTINCILLNNKIQMATTYFEDINNIINLNIKEDKDKILKTYIYLLNFVNNIKSFINNNYITISNTLNISEESLSKYIKILKTNKLICAENIKYINTKMGKTQVGMFYARNENELKYYKNVVGIL